MLGGVEQPCHSRSVRLDDSRELCVGTGAEARGNTVLLHGLLDSSEGWARLCGGAPRPAVRVRSTRLRLLGSAVAGIAGRLRARRRRGPRRPGSRFVHAHRPFAGRCGGRGARGADARPDRGADPVGARQVSVRSTSPRPSRCRECGPGPRGASARSHEPRRRERRLHGDGEQRQDPDPGLVERLTGRGELLVSGVREATRALVEASRSCDAFTAARCATAGRSLASGAIATFSFWPVTLAGSRALSRTPRSRSGAAWAPSDARALRRRGRAGRPANDADAPGETLRPAARIEARAA